MKRLSLLMSAAMFVTANLALAADAPKKKVNFPTKTVVITVPVSAGGGTDLLTRAMAGPLKAKLGQTVIVNNKTGAGGAIGFAAGAAEKPDGYNVTALVAELLTVPQVAPVNFSFKSFEPICNVNSSYGTITVRADAPYNTLQEFIAYAKAHPGEIKVGNSGVGGIWHFVAAAFASEAGIVVNHVPFEGGGSAVVALAGGHVDAVPVTPQEVEVQVKAGKAKILTVLAPKRLEEIANVPTAEELGFKNLVFTIWRGFGVPKGTPKEVVEILRDAFKSVLDDPSVTEFMASKHFAKDFRDSKDFYEMMEREEAAYAKQAVKLGLKK
jgi:tripartite-type tricarboxylate transporter receptor subunit TctC